MRRSPRTRLLAASVATLATISLAACGGDDDDTATTDATDAAASTDGSTLAEETAATVSVPGDTVADDTTPSSGGGEVAPREEYVDATRDEVDFEDEEMGNCFVESLVNDDVYAAIEGAGLTLDAYSSSGVGGLGLDETIARAVADDLDACGDLLPQLLADEVELACAQDNITNAQIAELIGFSFVGVDATDEALAASEDVETCIAESAPSTTS